MSAPDRLPAECAAVRELLPEVIHGTESPQVAAHLQSCAECAAEWARWRRVVTLVTGLPAPPPADGLAEQVVDFARVASALDALPEPAPPEGFAEQVLAFAEVSAALDRLPAPAPSADFAARVLAAVATPAAATTKPDSGVIRLRQYVRQRAHKAPVWIGVIAAHAAALLVFATIAVGTRVARREEPRAVDVEAKNTPEAVDPDGPIIQRGSRPPIIRDLPRIPIDPEIREDEDEPSALQPFDRPIVDPSPGSGRPKIDFGGTARVDRYLEKERQVRVQVLAWLGSRVSAEGREAASSAAGTAEWAPAVAKGLAWLRATQCPDGSWDVAALGGAAEHRVGLTALAVLAFAAEGHSPGSATDDANRQRVAAGWIGEQQDEDSGRIGPDSGAHLYDHGIALLALGELHALDLAYHWSIRHSDLRDRVRLGVRYLTEAQNADGGWGYRPRSASDTSVTVWQVAALKTADVLGRVVAAAPLRAARRWLAAVAHEDGRFGYHRRGDFPKGTVALAAAGAWGQQLAGEPGSQVAAASRAQLLARNAPGRGADPDRYAWYYATQVLHAAGGTAWDGWRDALGAALLTSQQPDGHWAARGDKYGDQGGRLYTTAMSLLALQAPQRYVRP